MANSLNVELSSQNCFSAWWGFSYADEKQRLVAFIRGSIRQGFCAPDLTNKLCGSHHNVPRLSPPSVGAETPRAPEPTAT